MVTRRIHRPSTATIYPSSDVRGVKPVTLHDGRVVDSYSEDYRLECEARTVLRMETLQKRRDYLEHVERKRGLDAANKLRDVMMALWKK